jgi:hypothetical protein
MRYTALLALLFGVSLAGQAAKKTTGPAPPALNRPGQLHPMPIPREDPVVPPDVRAPRHETGRERPVSANVKAVTNPSAGRRNSPKQKGRARALEVSEGKHEGWDKSKPHATPSRTRTRTGKR